MSYNWIFLGLERGHSGIAYYSYLAFNIEVDFDKLDDALNTSNLETGRQEKIYIPDSRV